MGTDVCDWLRFFLREGPREVSVIRDAARSLGYTKGVLREARRICRIVVTNNCGKESGVTDKWFWSLPEDDL